MKRAVLACLAIGALLAIVALAHPVTAAPDDHDGRTMPESAFVTIVPALRVPQTSTGPRRQEHAVASMPALSNPETSDKARTPVGGYAAEVVSRGYKAPRTPGDEAHRPGSASTSSLTGLVSWAVPSLGAGYLALTSYPVGTRVRLCGSGGCAEMVSNDVGPIPGLHRLADIAAGVWQRICGIPLSHGLCNVAMTVEQNPEP